MNGLLLKMMMFRAKLPANFNLRFLLILFLVSFASALNSVRASNDNLAAADRLVKDEKYKDAVSLLRKSPQSARNFYYQGYCYYRLKHEPESKQLFQFVLSQYPQSPEAKLADEFLRRIDPHYDSAPYKQTLLTQKASANSSALNQNARIIETPELLAKPPQNHDSKELGDLPQEARIFFTPAVSTGHMMVDASVDGHPVKCMFDTGAPGILFGKNQLRQLGILPPQGPATTSVSGWAGVALPAWTMKLKVKVANLERILPATIQEDFDLPPLIGYSFIRGYQYEIDQKAKCMLLKKEQRDEKSQSINSLYDLPCRILGTKAIVPVDINGRKTPFFIDTGAAITILNSRDAAALRIEIPSDAPVMMAGGVGGLSPYRAVNVDIRLGPIVRRDFQILIGGYAGNALGQDFMQGWRFSVDEKKSLLRFFH
ncbi:MAG: aspartyl protease family protein [Candidatus Obscuribacterales bacterium]|nr:aspartyl protease family protein [Candidatus Obscuribacterales bacterium]